MTNYTSLLLLSLVVSSSTAFAPPRFSSSSRRSTHHAMFTGIVEEMGTVVSLEERDDMMLWDGSKGKGTELAVKGHVVMEDSYLG
jgi:hypothetical protein